MQFLTEYGLFLAKAITLVVAILLLVGFISSLASRSKEAKDKLKIKKINKKFDDYKHMLEEAILSKTEYKQKVKELKRQEKSKRKQKKHESKPKIFVINFDGDIKASATSSLREEVTAILTVAKPTDEVVIRLESPGGIVPSYGLAATQLKRFRDHNIPLTAAIDIVAASGGYLMACVANNIIAAPLAIVGSIGVVAQLPNFHRYLKNRDIDFEQITAGEYKRTLSLFGENTEKGREKVKEDVENVQKVFKEFIATYRPQVNVDQVATGEHWHGEQALSLKLVDSLMSSDEYLMNASKKSDIFEIHYCVKKSLASKFSLSLQQSITYLTRSLSEKFQRIFIKNA